jgi:hypothetical protein
MTTPRHSPDSNPGTKSLCQQALRDESSNTQFVPTGCAVQDARAVTNVLDLTRPYRSPGAYQPFGNEVLAALILLADLRDWLTDVEPDLIDAAHRARITWEELALVLRVGDRRAAQRRHARRRWNSESSR